VADVSGLPGIGGTLFPGRFLAERGAVAAAVGHAGGDVERQRRRLASWWSSVERRCGPATGIRTLFDLVAMPLFAMLGYRAVAPAFDAARVVASLETPRRVKVGLLLLPWAVRPSSAWRDAVRAARAAGSEWCFVLAPPHLALLDARGHATRRAVEFTMPDVFEPGSADPFLALTSSGAFHDAHPPPIEALVAAGARFQDRVRLDLQEGVIQALGDLPPVLAERGVRTQDVSTFDEALTLVYRILFLLFAEARQLVPASHPVYRRAYSVGTLCRDALVGDTDGLWDALAAVTRLSRLGCRTDDLIVRPFNGQLFARTSAPSLEQRRRGSRLATIRTDRAARTVQRTLVALGTRPGPAGREPISYADLGVEQLGAVYERVLDLEPGRRKQTGTFYTPQPLAELVVRRTLAPLVAGRSSDAILALRVVDPAMGSGAFLVAACRFLADAYEHALVDEGRRTPHDIDRSERAAIRRLVAERCLAGVDVNPIAVQLARLSLWLASLARGKPLGFLDHQLRVGNSLIGASPDDLHRLADWRRPQRTAALPLFDDEALMSTMRSIADPLRTMRERPDDTVGDVRAKEALWRRLTGASSPVDAWRAAVSLWCARWFWSEGRHGAAGPPPPSAAATRAALDALLRGDRTLPREALAPLLQHARELGARFRFFHWPLEFADVFYEASGAPRAAPGFDAVIGNPPWEMLRRDAGPGVTGVPSPRSMLRFVRDSGLYPGCDRGHLNLYQPFVDRALALARPGGRVGLVLPWGFATDDGAQALRRRVFDELSVDTLLGLDNARGLFPIHRGTRFLVLTAGRSGGGGDIRARFGLESASELDDIPGRDSPGTAPAFPLRLTSARLAAVGGRTRRIPDLRSAGHLALLERLCREHPRLGARIGWAAEFGRELNATDDRASFGADGLAVLDGKHVTPFVADVSRAAIRIPRREAERLLPDRRFDRARLAYRDVSGVGNRRSLIAALVPAGVVTTHTLFCLRSPPPLEQQQFLCALFNSDLMNALVRMLMGGHVTTGLVEDLPVPAWRGSREQRRIAALARRLASHPDDEAAGAGLQTAVARLYGVAPAEIPVANRQPGGRWTRRASAL
jgi:hypothetical protein